MQSNALAHILTFSQGKEKQHMVNDYFVLHKPIIFYIESVE